MDILLYEGFGSFLWVFFYYFLKVQRTVHEAYFPIFMGVIFGLLTFASYDKTGGFLNPTKTLIFFLISQKYLKLGYYLLSQTVLGILGGVLAHLLFKTASNNKQKTERDK